MQCDCVNRFCSSNNTTPVPHAKQSPWGLQTCHSDPSAVKSAFLFDKRLRCDPISVLQMPRFPVMLFPFCFFFLLFSSLTLCDFSSSLPPLFKGPPGQLQETLHSSFLLGIIHHSPLHCCGLLSTGRQNPRATADTGASLPSLGRQQMGVPRQSSSPDTRPTPHTLLLSGCAKLLFCPTNAA